MSEKLIDVLNKLDVTNDNHWTAEGMPRLETVRMLSGNPALTRDDIVKVNPGFSRSFFAQNGPVVEPAVEMKPAVPAEEPVPVEAAHVPQEIMDSIEESMELDELQSAQAQLASLDAKLNEATRKRDAQQKVVDAILDAREKVTPQHSYEATQGYLESQKRNLEQRAERVKAVQNSGVDLKGLMASVAKSPLDTAMSRKNTRAASRPGVKK